MIIVQYRELLEKSPEPFILNVAAPDMKSAVIWDDLQMKQKYNGQQARFQGNRLNDLLGVWFTQHDSVKKIRYILFNPMAARTPGAAKMAGNSGFMKLTMNLYYKFFGKDVGEIVEIIAKDIASTKHAGLAAYKLDKAVDVSMETFDRENAERSLLHGIPITSTNEFSFCALFNVFSLLCISIIRIRIVFPAFLS